MDPGRNTSARRRAGLVRYTLQLQRANFAIVKCSRSVHLSTESGPLLFCLLFPRSGRSFYTYIIQQGEKQSKDRLDPPEQTTTADRNILLLLLSI